MTDPIVDPLVSGAWLAEHLTDSDVQVVDATWYMPAEGKQGRHVFEAAHIPGAVFFDIDGIADRTVDLPHMLPTPEAFAEAAGALGLRREATVVVYDAQGIFSAPRVWWTLRVMGFPRVFVLDGGLPKWRADGHPVIDGPGAPAAQPLATAFRAELVRDLKAVSELVRTGSAQMVDARSGPRFRGEAPEPRSSLRGGHMPGACNTPFGEVITRNGTLKPAAELEAVFETAGVDLAKPIVTTCGSGLTASVLALALARLGREDVAVYDGSWTEWGGRPDTAIVTGA
jgi:thiosulfate/3-mercaptopyruvate sulfurtransferase